MAIFTTLNHQQIAGLLACYKGLPTQGFVSHGVPMGTVNTYYRVRFRRAGEYFLKIDEVADLARLKNELLVLSHLHRHSKRLPFATPFPLRTQLGRFFLLSGKKPALLFPGIKGRIVFEDRLTHAHLKKLGAALAALHALPVNPRIRPHRFDLSGQKKVFSQIRARLRRKHPKLERFITAKLSELQQNAPRRNNEVLIHADLFAENAHWIGNRLNGILDFEAAGRGDGLFDVAVCLHALCHTAGGFTAGKIQAFLKGYSAVRRRPIDPARIKYFMEQSAMRFLLTRLRDFELANGMVKAEPFKDYREFVQRFDEIKALAIPLTKQSAV